MTSNDNWQRDPLLAQHLPTLAIQRRSLEGPTFGSNTLTAKDSPGVKLHTIAPGMDMPTIMMMQDAETRRAQGPYQEGLAKTIRRGNQEQPTRITRMSVLTIRTSTCIGFSQPPINAHQHVRCDGLGGTQSLDLPMAPVTASP